MKKILMGLMAISAISFAAAPDLSKPAEAGQVVFSNAVDGAIPVKGNLTSTPQIVRYVVFAGTSNSAAAGSIELQLTNFVLSQKEGTAGFIGENPKLYVKKVSDSNQEEALTNENVKFRLSLPTPVTGAAGTGSTNDWIGAGQSLDIYATALAPSAVLQKIITDNGWSSSTHISRQGTLATPNDASNKYMIPKVIHLASETNGEFSFTSVIDPNWATNTNKYKEGSCKIVEEAFRAEIAIDPAIKVEVTIQ